MTTPILSSRGRKANKPSKPRKDFPLFPHDSGQWAKKVRGKLFYFGKWDDPVQAEKKWERDKEALLDGRNPEDAKHGDSVGWLCNSFMDSKQLQHDRGELTKRALNDYHRAVKHVSEFFGKGRRLDSLRSNDFERYRNSLPETWGPTSVNNHLRLVRVVFKYANDIEATEREIRYKLGLKSVPLPVVRKDQALRPTKEFSVDEVWRLYSLATAPMKAFVLLGLNCAYGTMDIARLRIDAIDFDKQWLGEMRGKTGVARGAWLWPETISAIRDGIKAKPSLDRDATSPTGSYTRETLEPLAFITRNRRPWGADGEQNNPLATAFNKLKLAAKIEKEGVGHYALRHTFATVATNAKDQQAVDFIMGHYDPSMSALYREGIDPARVKAVCEYVRKWFIAGKPKQAKGGAK